MDEAMATVTQTSINSTATSTITTCINATLSINTTMDNTTALNTSIVDHQIKLAVISRIWFSTCGYNFDSSTSSVCAAAYWVIRILPTIILVFGTIGNIVNIIILKRPALNKNTATIYLQCLAVTDLIAVWFSVVGLWKKVMPESMTVDKFPMFCLLVKFIGSYSYSCSTWVLTQLSVVRSIMASFPFFGKRIITRSKIRVAIAINMSINFIAMATIMIIEQMYVLQTNDRMQCMLENETPIGTFYSYWVLSYDIIIPFVILCVSNCVIIYSLIQHGQKFQQRSGKEQNRSLNRTLVLVSTYFLLSFIPFQSFQVTISRIKTDIDEQEIEVYSFVNDLFFLIGSSNFAVNCAFYFMNGSVFRTEWKEMTAPLRKRMTEIFTTTPSVVSDNSPDQAHTLSPM